MSDFRVCDAKNMADEFFDDDEIYPCFEAATVQVVGYWLCDGCAHALRVFCEISQRMTGGPTS